MTAGGGWRAMRLFLDQIEMNVSDTKAPRQTDSKAALKGIQRSAKEWQKENADAEWLFGDLVWNVVTVAA